MDAVLDTNVVVSAVISPKGPPAQVLEEWRAGRFNWVTSEALIAEVAGVLRSRRLRRFLPWTREELDELLLLLSRLTNRVAPTETLDVVHADPTDNRVLEAALEGHADYMVSGDSDLLELGEFRGIPIVSPARFVAILHEQDLA